MKSTQFTKKWFAVIAVVLITLTSSCNANTSDDNTNDALPLSPTESTGSEIADVGAPFNDLSTFERALMDAVIERDQDTLAELMRGRDFNIAAFLSESSTWEPNEGAGMIVTDLLPPDNVVVFLADADLTEVLGGGDPLTMWGREVTAVSALYSQGWDEDGAGEALLIVAEHPEGGYYWHALLIASLGFDTVSESDDIAVLQAAIVTHDFDAMGLPAVVANWDSAGILNSEDPDGILEQVIPFTSEQLAFEFLDFYLPPGGSIVFDNEMDLTDIAALLGVEDALIFWGIPADSIVAIRYSTGWGFDGLGEAILVFALSTNEESREEETVWYALLYAPNGFATP